MLSLCNQHGSGCITTNLNWIDQQAQIAVDQGATVFLLPENCSLMPADESSRNQAAEAFGDGPIQSALADIAQRQGIWVIAGSLSLRFDDQLLPAQTQLVFDSQGQRKAHYRKIHLFDVRLDNGEHYAESDYTVAGEQLVVCDSPIGKLGLSICYDLRFPAQYQALAAAGAEILIAPAAFTATTGAAHWHTLLRARAIENQCYMAASAQVGTHESGRSTYGHALLYDPWGELVLDLGANEGCASARIDRAKIKTLRERFPLRNKHKELGNVIDTNG